MTSSPNQHPSIQEQHHGRSGESKSLRYLLNPNRNSVVVGEEDVVEETDNAVVTNFFDHIYQHSVAIYRTNGNTDTNNISANSTSMYTYTPWSPSTVTGSSLPSNPLTDVLENGYSMWYDLMNEQVPLQQQRRRDPQPEQNRSDILIFQNQQIVSLDDNGDHENDNGLIQRYSSRVRTTTINDKNSDKDDDATTSTDPPLVILNLHAAYLDGCSIVMNHADTLHPTIAALCDDLQSSFPHVYANVYVTPISTQTVPAHADDRDVFIVQVLGCKLWTIYANIPVPFPYPHEQVGKSTALPVPDQVRQGPILFQSILQPGDVLYIPRGYVHEAQCVPFTAASNTSATPPRPLFGSFHITIAIATHDWSLLGILRNATSDILSSTQLLPVHYRKAIDRQFGQHPTLLLEPSSSSSPPPVSQLPPLAIPESNRRDSSIVSNNAVVQLQQQIDTVLRLLQQEITVSNINQALYNKYTFHNQRASQQRNHMIQQYVTKQQQRMNDITLIHSDDIGTLIGYEASRTVTLQTYVRAVTDQEKKQIATHSNHPQQMGLNVRPEIYEDIMTILHHVKTHTSQSFQVFQLQSLIVVNNSNVSSNNHTICDMTLLSFARRCVELGALAIVPVSNATIE